MNPRIACLAFAATLSLFATVDAARAAVGDEARGHWAMLVSPDGEDGSIAIRQDVRLFVARLDAGMQLQHQLHPQRRYWLQVIRGASTAAARELAAGDAIGLVEEAGHLTVVATQATEVLLFDLP